MEWIIYAILAYLFWTNCNIISKVILTKYVKNIFVFAILIGFIGLIPIILIPFKGLNFPGLNLFLISLITGALYIYALTPYFKALSIEEVSRIIPLWRFTPIFVLVFATIFIGENLSLIEIIAFSLLMGGGFLISIKKFTKSFKVSNAFYLMIFSSLLFGIYHTLTKYVYLNQPFYDGFIFIRIGSFLGSASLLLLKKYRIALVQTWYSISRKVKGTIIAYELSNFIGLVLFNYAVSITSVSIISATTGFQSIFVFIAALVISKKYPKILKEETTTKVIVQKILSILLILVGVALILMQ